MQENYIALSGALAMERRLGMISNNLANVNTLGFRGDHIKMRSVPGAPDYAAMDRSTSPAMDAPPTRKTFYETLYGVLDGQVTDFRAGSFQQTDNQFDLAIEGDAFFAVQTPNGIRYTRQGNFTRAADNTMVSQDGFPALDAAGAPIRIDTLDFGIGPDGTITDDTGMVLGQVMLATFPDTFKLNKEGHGLFELTDENVQPFLNAPSSQVRQGYVEMSNVSVVDEMVDMITTQRNYETFQKLITTSSDMSSSLIAMVAQ